MLPHAEKLSSQKLSLRVSLVLCLCTLLWGGPAARAQVDQGTITGIVQDSSGAVIPNVQVTVTDLDTGLVLQTKTNASGTYVVSPLKIGNYTVTATAQGFQTVTQENLHVDAQQRLNVNLTLNPGSVSQTVTVTSAPPVLQTQDATREQR